MHFFLSKILIISETEIYSLLEKQLLVSHASNRLYILKVTKSI